MPLLTPGQERKSGRRWRWVAVTVLALPLVLAAMLYAVLAWGPIPRPWSHQLGPVVLICGTEVPPYPWLKVRAYDISSPNNPGHLWIIGIGHRLYGVEWRGE